MQLKSSIKERLKLIQPAVTEEDSEYVASGIVKVETQLNSVRQCLVFTICIHNNIHTCIMTSVHLYLQISVSEAEVSDPIKNYNKLTFGDLKSLWPDV